MISGLIEDIINVVLSRSIYAVLLFMIVICYIINMFHPKDGEEVVKNESEVGERDVYDFERRIEQIESRKVETESKSVQKDLEKEEEVDIDRFEKLVRSLESTKSKIEELKHQMAETKAEKEMVVRLSNDMLERIEKVTKNSKSDPQVELKDDIEINEKIDALEKWFIEKPKMKEERIDCLRERFNGDSPFTICDNLEGIFAVKPPSSQAESRPETSESSNVSGDSDLIKPGIVTGSPEFRNFLGSIAQTDSD